MPLGASEKPRRRLRDAGRWWCSRYPPACTGLMPAWGRTGAVGGISRVVPRSSGEPHAAQPVSTKALGEVQRRITTHIGAPQVGQRATRSGGGGGGGGGCSPAGALPDQR